MPRSSRRCCWPWPRTGTAPIRRKVELQAFCPRAERAKLDEAFAASAKELLAAGIEVGYSKEVRTGFKVGAKDGGYYISFSDADFDALMKEYLREKVAHLLYEA